MKIYFAASVTGGRKFEKQGIKIVQILNNLGHKVLTEHVSDWNLQLKLREKARKSKNIDKFIASHNKKLMKKADILIAECSQGSLGVGFEICYFAYVLKKPVVCIRNKKIIGKASSTIFGDELPLIKTYKYDVKGLGKLLSSILTG